VDDAEEAFARVVSHFRPPVSRPFVGVSPLAVVRRTARLEHGVSIYPGAYVGDEVCIGRGSTIYPNAVILERCQLGRDVTVFPGAVLYENTVVGDRSILHAGAVIGAYGFGYRTRGGRHVLSAQLGNVEIGADVEIGANTTVDRGTYGPTTIGDGTKLDNQVMIGHNCRIGPHNLLCSQVGIAGSSTTGAYVVMGGQAGVSDHVVVGDQASLAAKCGLKDDVPGGQMWVGIPARPVREQMIQFAMLAKLPEMRKQLARLQQRLQELEARTAPQTSASDIGQQDPGMADRAA
jgi:UDP-3-O-[3-hydroxymyristoyl] glucosamine N-acyltransferase